MGACASVAKAMRGDAGKAAPPPEQPAPEETTAPAPVEGTITEKEVPAGETSEIMSEEPKEILEPEATTAPPEAEAIVPSVEEKEPEAKA